MQHAGSWPIKSNTVRLIVYGCVLFWVGCSAAHGQARTYSGYLADSLTLIPLAGVHVAVKSRLVGTVSSEKGFFSITASPADTLVFSLTGYHTYELPLLFEEDVLFIRLREKVTYLDEVEITASRLPLTSRPARPLPRPLPEASAFASPIEYFSRWQREKRQLLRLTEANNSIFVYNQVINDPHLQRELIAEFNITQAEYYNLLTLFNRQHREVQYFTDAEKIIEALRNFIKQQTK
jgi:hypothetical protein